MAFGGLRITFRVPGLAEGLFEFDNKLLANFPCPDATSFSLG
jgi:hypothetical protein